jgi:hypothetical protein
MRPSRTPTPTPRVPAAELYIWNPGPLSKVISPIRLDAYAHTGANGLITVALLGEDGRLLYRQVLRYGTLQGAVVPLDLDVPFEISAVAETGRLVVSIEDGYKRPIAITAVDVILQSLGSNDLTPSGDGLQAIAIQQPRNNQSFEGGTLLVKGMARPSSSQPMLVELVTADGAVIASRQSALQARPDGTHAPFEIELPYSVTKITDARVIARQQGDRLDGMLALASAQVWLKP